MADTQIKTRILLRNDVAAAWTAANPVLMKGEIGIETDTNKFKIGDGVKAWSALPYVGTDIEIAGSGSVIVDAVVNKSTGKLTLTKGDVTDEDIILANDYTFTVPVGTVTIDSTGSTVVPAQGKTLKEFLGSLFAKAKDPTVTNPSVSISLTGAGAKEVGTLFTPSYSVSFNAGSYQYGPATGITATYSVNDNDNPKHTSTAASGNFTVDEKAYSFTVGDTTNYKVSVTATHTEGAVPKNNLGSEVPSKKIASGTKSADSGAVTGYRNSFWGSLNSKNGTPTSAVIRVLSGRKNGAISAGYTGDASEAVGAMRVIIAVPSPRTITSIKDVNGLNAEAFSAFTHITVNVEGANGYEAKTYNVYYKDNAAENDKENKWHFTVA